MRLSWKAQEAVEELTACLSQSVRTCAAAIAEQSGREFADEKDAKEAYKRMILTIAEAFGECAEEIKRLGRALKDAIPFLDHNHFAHKIEEMEGNGLRESSGKANS